MGRECASPWNIFKGGGKGKGGKEGGQFQFGGKGHGGGAKGFGGFKGQGKGGGGKSAAWGVGKGGGNGKGYQGWCWDCGQQGHKKGEGKCGGEKPMDMSAVEWGWEQPAQVQLAAVGTAGGAGECNFGTV